MSGQISKLDVEAVLARLDRSSSDTLLRSIARELSSAGESHAALLARIVALESLLKVSDRLLGGTQTLAAESLPGNVLIEAIHSLPSTGGFYGLEYDIAGAPYRWTGPNPHFSIDFFIDRRSGAKFIMRFSMLYARDVPHYIRCMADGEEIKVTTTPVGKGFETTGELAARVDGGATVLSFICPATASPAQLELTDDHRQLGLAFQWLRVHANGAALPNDTLANPNTGSLFPVQEP